MNTVVLIGRLTKDPELRYTSSERPVTSFTLAVDRPFKSADGQKQTDFLNIVVWGKQAENCANYLAKGRLAAVRGSVQSRSYETKEGDKRYITEIVADNVQFLEWGERNAPASQAPYPQAPAFSEKPRPSAGAAVFEPEGLDPEGFRALDDDDVPF